MTQLRMQVGAKAGREGFTIVELLIVVVVIAILATITVVALNGIKDRANRASLASSLAQAAKKMHTAKIAADNIAPTTIPGDMNVPQNIGMSLSTTGMADQFCINAILNATTPLRMYYDSATSQTNDGICPGATIGGSETGSMPVNLILSPDSASAWSMNTSAGGVTLTSRAGAAGDPFPTKPVLVFNNATSRTVTWVYLRTAVDTAKITTGNSYATSFWVRKTGSAPAVSMNMFGVMDGSTANAALSQGAATAVGTNWTLVSRNVTAARDAVATNGLYSALTPYSALTTTGWGLEFQGFELYAN